MVNNGKTIEGGNFMGLLSNLFGGSPSARDCGVDDSYVSQRDYEYAQKELRKVYDAQQSGDTKKAQKQWETFKKNTGYKG